MPIPLTTRRSWPRRQCVLRRLAVGLALGGGALAIACGIGVQRDYSAIPVGQVGFDDLCGLQDYFDTIEAKLATAPALVSAVDMENQSNRRIQGGKNRFSFETDFQLKHLRRVLNQNWNRLPEALPRAERVDIEVHWSEKAGVRRVVTDGDADLIIKDQSFPLPYHVCLSELLFGEPLYHQRREMTGGSLPYRSLLSDAGLASARAPAPGDAGVDSAAATRSSVIAPAPPARPAPAAPSVAPPATPPARRAPDGGVGPSPAAVPLFKSAPPAH